MLEKRMPTITTNSCFMPSSSNCHGVEGQRRKAYIYIRIDKSADRATCCLVVVVAVIVAAAAAAFVIAIVAGARAIDIV